jgi:signal transduction histidine kinase
VTRRLLASYLAITVIVLAILTYPLGQNYERKRLDDVTTGLVGNAYLIAAQVEESVAAAAPDPVDDAWIHNYVAGTELRVVALTSNGDVILDSQVDANAQESLGSNMGGRPEIIDLFASRTVQTGHRRSNTLKTELAYVVVPVVRDGAIIGAVRVSFPTTAARRAVVDYWKTLVAIWVVSLLLVAAIGVVLARSFGRPIRDLERAAVEFGAGRLDRRATDLGGPPEIVSLRNAFNTTANGLETLVKRQQSFVADASHQLRTPLTGLRLRLENLEGEVTDYGREDLEQAVAQTDRLSRMVDGLLTLARADKPTTWSDCQPLLIEAVLQARLDDWEPFAAERSIHLTMSCRPGLMAMSNADRLSQVLDNLIANAFDALAKTDGQERAIRLLAWPEPEHVQIHVIDNGPGLSPTERARAFDRFWRADPSQTDGFGGTGLGLSIAASMLAADKGTIRLEAAEGGGLDAMIRLTRGDVALKKPTTKPHR